MKRFIFIILLCVFLVITTNVTAGPADPKTKIVNITASVADNIPPTTPILISPADNSYVTTGYVTFVWQGSTDSNGIKEYELVIDGSVLITDIPPNDAETSQFTLNYDAITNYYTLQVKDLIVDGTHTWKIIAIDTLENGSDSATWSFTIDSQAPNFILSQVGEVPTSISAQDISTIPTQPIELNDNRPQLLGHGEPNSTILLTVTIPGDPTQTFTNTTDINGNWGQQLGILPRNTIITLDFVITDQAGLVSVLNHVQLIIKTKIIIFPPAAVTPSPSSAIIPTPGVTPPPINPNSPLISIPLIPPIEIAHEILQETWEHLPAPIKAIVARVPAQTREYLITASLNLFTISALLLLVLIGLLALLAMIRRFGKNLSPRLIWRTLQALGLCPGGKPQGLVYDSLTHQGLPFVLIEVRNEADETIDQVVTDKNGIYRGLALKPGQYRLLILYPDYYFPTNQLRPTNLTNREFYLGEIFDISDQYPAKNHRLYLIPIDLEFHEAENKPQVSRPLQNFNSLSQTLFFPFFIMTGILTIIFPTFWNWVALSSYWIQIIIKAWSWFKTPDLTGQVIAEDSQLLENVIVGAIDLEANQFVALTQTHEKGFFAANLATTKLELSIVKPGYMWVENNSPITEYDLDPNLKTKQLILTMKKLS